jgi:excisionase family DNA binding protein
MSRQPSIIKQNIDSVEFLTLREVAHRLRVDQSTVRRWCKQNTLPSISLPHTGKREVLRIPATALQKLVGVEYGQ